MDYRTVSERPLFSLPEGVLNEEIATWCTANPKASPQEIIRFSQQLMAAQTSFVIRSTPSEPGKVVAAGQANCIGYSRLFAAILSQVAKVSDREITQRHLVGQLYFLSFNLHEITNDPFWGNHDYNAVTDVATGETYYVDPTLYDYLWIAAVRGPG